MLHMKDSDLLFELVPVSSVSILSREGCRRSMLGVLISMSGIRVLFGTMGESVVFRLLIEYR